MTTIDLLMTVVAVASGVALGGSFAAWRYSSAIRAANDARPRFFAFRCAHYEPLSIDSAFVGAFFSMAEARNQVLLGLGEREPEEAHIYDLHRNEWRGFSRVPGGNISEDVDGFVVRGGARG